jgi:hypothetical protein
MANDPPRLGATYAADQTTSAIWPPGTDRVSVANDGREIGLPRLSACAAPSGITLVARGREAA